MANSNTTNPELGNPPITSTPKKKKNKRGKQDKVVDQDVSPVEEIGTPTVEATNGIKAQVSETPTIIQEKYSTPSKTCKRKHNKESVPAIQTEDSLKKRKTSVADASDSGELGYITFNLQLIKAAQAAHDNSALLPCLLRTTKFVRDQLIPKLDSKSAEDLLLSIFELLSDHAQRVRILKQWILGIFAIHGAAISKNSVIIQKIDVFFKSSESRGAVYNSLSKLSSRVDLILNQRKQMLSSRKSEVATSEQQESESSEESSVEDLSSDDEHVAFASSNLNWQDSDFLGQPDEDSSEYESERSFQANGVAQNDSSDSD